MRREREKEKEAALKAREVACLYCFPRAFFEPLLTVLVVALEKVLPSGSAVQFAL